MTGPAKIDIKFRYIIQFSCIITNILANHSCTKTHLLCGLTTDS